MSGRESNRVSGRTSDRVSGEPSQPRQTRVAAVIGDPVRHSRSPALHNAAFAEAGLDWAFTTFEVPPGHGAAALEAMRVLGLAGLSVTMPLKAEVAQAADTVDEAVDVLGVANCVVAGGDGRLRACNTDGAGFLAGLSADAAVTPQGKRVVVMGAGGAARAVVWAVASAGASDVAVLNRTGASAASAARLAGDLGRVGDESDIASADLVVNATPVGMGSDRGMPCDPGLLRDGAVAVDLVYEPLETAWLRALRSAGIASWNGLSMLVGQAAVAFELWTAVTPAIAVMRRAARPGAGCMKTGP